MSAQWVVVNCEDRFPTDVVGPFPNEAEAALEAHGIEHNPEYKGHVTSYVLELIAPEEES